MIFVSSDHHFNHGNVIKYDNRPFTSLYEHNETLVKYWNETVDPKDEVYYLGDLIFRGSRKYVLDILYRLNGKIYLLMGNHDHRTIKGIVKDRFEWIKNLHILKIKDDKEQWNITLCHYAMRTWYKSHWGYPNVHLYGHSHGNLEENKSLSFDVGCMCHNYRPMSFGEVKERMQKKWRILKKERDNSYKDGREKR